MEPMAGRFVLLLNMRIWQGIKEIVALLRRGLRPAPCPVPVRVRDGRQR